MKKLWDGLNYWEIRKAFLGRKTIHWFILWKRPLLGETFSKPELLLQEQGNERWDEFLEKCLNELAKWFSPSLSLRCNSIELIKVRKIWFSNTVKFPNHKHMLFFLTTYVVIRKILLYSGLYNWEIGLILVFRGKSRIYECLCLINITLIWEFLRFQLPVLSHYMYLQSLSSPKMYCSVYCVLHYQFAAKCFEAVAVFTELTPMLLKRTAIKQLCKQPTRCNNIFVY